MMHAITTRDGVTATGLTVGELEEYSHGMVAFDAHGHRLGEVDDLIVDAVTGATRFLVVESSGLFSMLSVRRLIPVDVVDRVGTAVRVHRSAEHVRQGRRLAPDGWSDPEVVRQACEHYQLTGPAPLVVRGPVRGTA